MKALKPISLLFITLIALSSCYRDNEDVWFVDEFQVESRHWQLVGGVDQEDSYYEYIFDRIPDGEPYYEGIVTAYMYLDYNTDYEVQTPLPYTEYRLGTDGHGNDVYYSIHFTYDVKADGTIAFKAYVSDHYTGSFNPGTQTFRVAILWNEEAL